MFCENCGTQINDNARLCPGCGAPQNAAPAPAQTRQPAAHAVCHNCGAQLAANAKFCDACGTQTATEQAAIREQRVHNADAHMDKSISGSVWITVAMVLFSLFFIIVVGFEEGEPMVMTVTAIAFSVFMTALKWYFEIKAQRRWKREAEEKAKESSRHVL